MLFFLRLLIGGFFNAYAIRLLVALSTKRTLCYAIVTLCAMRAVW